MNRITMNSNSLQNGNSDVYTHFFANNDLVLSGYNVMPWTFFGYNFDSFRIKQKVNTKTYCGIRFTNDMNIKFGDVVFYDIKSNTFQKMKFSDSVHHLKEVITYIQEIFTEYQYSGGIEISFLSENPKGHGFGFSGVSSGLISMALSLVSKKISTQDITLYSEEFVQSEKFSHVINVGCKLESIFRGGKSVGTNCYASLINYGLPILSVDKELNFVKLTDFLGIHTSTVSLPLDYGVIFLGSESTFTDNVYVHESLNSENVELEKFIGGKIGKKITHNSFSQTVFDFSNILNVRIIKGFMELLNKPYDEFAVSGFINNIKNYSNFIHIIEHENKLIRLMYDFFHSLKSFNDEDIGIFPINSSKLGGGYIFVMKYNKSRQTLEKVFEEIHKKGLNYIYLEYCSYLDGTASAGVELEQYVLSGVYSKYVDKNNVVYKDNKGQHYLGNYSKILEKSNEGMIFDKINNKIYFFGEKLTSKDIPSQNTTIEVISKLLENIGEEISNKELPSSSYTGNKNEMLGKILLPLLKLVEERTGEKLPIVCKGSITDFFIKIENMNLKVGIIKKI